MSTLSNSDTLSKGKNKCKVPGSLQCLMYRRSSEVAVAIAILLLLLFESYYYINAGKFTWYDIFILTIHKCKILWH